MALELAFSVFSTLLLLVFSFFLLLVLEYNENDLLEDRGQSCQNWPFTNAFKKNACFVLESKLTD